MLDSVAHKSVMKSNDPNSNQVVNDDDFWLYASEPSLDAIWNNSEDDIYAELVEAVMTKTGGTDEHIRRNN